MLGEICTPQYCTQMQNATHLYQVSHSSFPSTFCVKIKHLFVINKQINTFSSLKPLEDRKAIFPPRVMKTIKKCHIPPMQDSSEIALLSWEETNAEQAFQLNHTIFDATQWSILVCSGASQLELLKQIFKEHKEWFKENASTTFNSYHCNLT